MMIGTRDVESPWHVLRGFEDTVVRHVYTFLATEWGDHVTLTIPANCVGKVPRRPRPPGDASYPGIVAFATCGSLTFPEPADRNVNMLPFIFGDKESLPENLQCYHDCIEACPYSDSELGRVGYLTVHESFVAGDTSQRRPGLHVETPGTFRIDDGMMATLSSHLDWSITWGAGYFRAPDSYEGGIFMASSVANTSRIFDALVDKNKEGITDRHGGCEQLRPIIGPGTQLKANELVWMTDVTPHEALIQEHAGYRQFFRVVTSNISHWFADHCTPNPLVPLPENVVVVHGNKFE